MSNCEGGGNAQGYTPVQLSLLVGCVKKSFVVVNLANKH